MTAGTPRPPSEPENPALVIRDKRRIDPATGRPRAQPGGEQPTAAARGDRPPQGPGTPSGVDSAEQELTQLSSALAERTADLQRVKAEYDNYRRRIERDRQQVSARAIAVVLAELLPVLDDVGRARESGELTGGFRSIAESLESLLAKLGLRRFGEVGERFDPRIHEAISHVYSDEVDQPTCIAVVQPGYLVGERLLRPARVAVAEPTAPFGPVSDETGNPG